MPNSEVAERSVLGAALQSDRAMNEIVETLFKEDFYFAHHAEIFEAIQTLYHSGVKVDLITVREELSKKKKLELVGGTEYLGTLSDGVPSPLNALHYKDIVKQKSILRSLISTSEQIIEQSYAQSDDAEDIVEDAERAILEISKGAQKKDYETLSEVLSESNRILDERKGKMGELIGIPTGFPKLDRLTSGLQRSDLIILAARPGMGKTSLALNIAMNAAKTAGAQVMIFSLEMGSVQLGNRLLASEAGVDSYAIRDGSVYKNKDDVERLAEATSVLSSAPIFINSTSGISINEIKNKCRRKKAKGGLDLVVVDYLQLMDFGGTGKASSRPENRQQEVATLSRMLKQLAMEMDCPVLVLSQLSRGIESRTGHKPMLSDLRESGAIEQDADIVMFIYQKEGNDKEDGSGGDPEDIRRLYIAKHRNGETSEIQVRWVGKYTKFGHYNPEDDVRTLV